VRRCLYQLEVKAALVDSRFSPSQGWNVTVGVDAMERAHGGRHLPDKRERAEAAEQRLKELGARIGPDKEFGRADIVARHPSLGTVVVEVEGDSSRQREQTMYSALGQTLLNMRETHEAVDYALAVPDSEDWREQLGKVPKGVADRLRLRLYLVSEGGVRQFDWEDER
jgi:hypothetical protein